MEKKMSKYELAGIILCGINVIAGLVMYFILPEKIPVQWSGNQISSERGKIYIFLFPLLSVIFVFLGKGLFQWVSYRWSRVMSESSLNFISLFMQIVFMTCQLYIILFVYGLRLTISTILIIELVIGIIVFLKLMKR